MARHCSTLVLRHPARRAALTVTLAALLVAGCVGSTEGRRGGPRAAYGGPVIGTSGETSALLVGRFAKDVGQDGAPTGARFAWSGSSMTARFRGTALSVELSERGNDQYLVVVDGRPLREKLVPAPGRGVHELVRGLPRAEHTVTLTKLTEPAVGEATFHGFVLGEHDEPLPPPPHAERRIELIGDSISAGYGNEGKGPDCGFSPDTENHYLTYGARAARELDAELTTLAWSGKGVSSNRGQAGPTMSDLWDKTLPAGSGVPFDFSAPPPDVVLINLGTNDFAPEVSDTTPFAPALARLVESVRGRYPDAAVVLLVGPLLTDDYPPGKQALRTVRGVVTSLVSERRAAGDAKIHELELSRATPEEGFGCDYHPSEPTHRRMAARLVGFLRETLGW